MMTIDCMACLVKESPRGCDILLEGITHSAYVDITGTERLTCRWNKVITFRALWLDAVTRAARGLRPRPGPTPSMQWVHFLKRTHFTGSMRAFL